jgi:hypothetical protein
MGTGRLAEVESLLQTVPNIVPTPCIEALPNIASRTVPFLPKFMTTRNLSQSIATTAFDCKFLILRWFLPPEQKVGGSNPLGRTTTGLPHLALRPPSSFRQSSMEPSKREPLLQSQNPVAVGLAKNTGKTRAKPRYATTTTEQGTGRRMNSTQAGRDSMKVRRSMKTVTIRGTVRTGLGHFARRMTEHAHVFAEAFGCPPRAGTINVKVDHPIRIQPESSIPDPMDAKQELLIERCAINGLPAFRIRPSVIGRPALGGHGDDTLEISSCTEVPGIAPGAEVTVEFFRECIGPDGMDSGIGVSTSH